MKRLYGLLLILLAPALAVAQTTVTLSGALPFDLQGLQAPRFTADWKYQQGPLSLKAGALLTPQGWPETKLSFAYKISTLEASAQAEFTPQELKKAESKFKFALKDVISLESEVNFESYGFKGSSVKLKLGPSALNLSTNAKLTPQGLSEEKVDLNFSLSLGEGDLGGTTSFTKEGFKQQTLSVSSPLEDPWSLTMASTLTLQGLKSQSFEINTRLGDANLSVGFTVESVGITSESLALDVLLGGLFVQLSADFSGLGWTGLQAMAVGSVGSLAVNALAMLSPDSLQLVKIGLGGRLLGFHTEVDLDLSWLELTEIDLRVNLSLSGSWLGFRLASELFIDLGGLLSTKMSVSRPLCDWSFTLELNLSTGSGFASGAVRLERSWKLP